ncbi:MAG TPA: hypothetical protein VLK32_09115 [Bacillota bacterium]|nr:hypothetical protein [Bacillota bacterium]
MATSDAASDGDRERKVVEAVRQAAVDGRLTCAGGLDLARRLGVAPALVGRACDQLGVKIASCQLGCFR